MRRKTTIATILFLAALTAGCSLPLCNDGEVVCRTDGECSGDHCSESRNQSNPNPCLYYICHNENWEYIDSCPYGFYGTDRDTMGCVPECNNGDVKCTFTDENKKKVAVSPMEDRECIFSICKDKKFLDLKTCDHGYYDTDQKKDCIPTCKFGYDSSWACNNPCELNGQQYSLVSDGKNILSCSTSDGWTIDHTCTQDFAFDDSDDSATSLAFPEWTQIASLKVHYPELDTTQLKPGKCGSCSKEITPDICNEFNDKKYIHTCKNGSIEIHEASGSECDAFTTECTDALNQTILVDTNTNRYYCGSCSTQCDTRQICQQGKCQNIDPVKESECVDGYYNMQMGSRTFHAYCIKNAEDLRHTGERYPDDNFDNAYILVNDIALENWQPLEQFTGVLYGNDKTINYKSVKDDDYQNLGLYRSIVNAHIENLKIQLATDDMQFSIPNTSSTYTLGLMAAKTSHSNLNNIQISNFHLTFVTKVDDPNDKSSLASSFSLCIGEAQNVEFSNIFLEHSSISVGANVNKAAIGGIVGTAKNTKIRHARVTDFRAAATDNANTRSGGIAGIIGYGSGNSLTDIEASNLTITGSENTAAIVGHADNSDFHDIALDTISLAGEDKVGGIVGEGSVEIQSGKLNHIAIQGNSYLGSMIGDGGGSITGITAENIEINYAGKNCGNNTQCESSVTSIGGGGGYLSGTFRDITLNGVTIQPKDDQVRANNLGGFGGEIWDGGLTNVHVKDVNIQGTSAIGGLAGMICDMYASAYIAFCRAESISLVGTSSIGGLIGDVAEGYKIRGSLSEAKSIVGDSCLGGLIGQSIGVDSDDKLSIDGTSAYSHIKPKENVDKAAGFIGCVQRKTVNLGNISSVSFIEDDSATVPMPLFVANVTDDAIVHDKITFTCGYTSFPNLKEPRYDSYDCDESYTPGICYFVPHGLLYSPQSCYYEMAGYGFSNACNKDTQYYNDVDDDYSNCFNLNNPSGKFISYELWDGWENVECSVPEFRDAICQGYEACKFGFIGQSDAFSIHLPIYHENPGRENYVKHVVVPSFCKLLNP